MANRLTDTDKWSKAWYCSLTPTYKLFWNYLCDNCNIAGIWSVNWALVKFHIWNEEPIDATILGDRVKVLSETKWFIVGFVEFQQKIHSLDELNPNNKAHLGIIRILIKDGILNTDFKGASKGLQSPPGIGIGIGVGKGIGKGSIRANFTPPTIEEVRAYCLERKNGVDATKWHNFYTGKGWMIGKNKMKDWQAAVRTWEKDSPFKGTPRKEEPAVYTRPDPKQMAEVARLAQETLKNMRMAEK